MNESHAALQSTILTPHDAALLLAIAGRCRNGLTTVDDAEALEDLARQVVVREGKQIQKLPA